MTTPTTPHLSPQQTQLIRHIAAGHDRRTTARHMGLSITTIDAYLKAVRRRLGADNLPHAVAIAAHAGLLTDPEPDTPAAEQ